MKGVREYIEQFRRNATPAELERIAIELVEELYELKAERGGDDISLDDMTTILRMQDVRWRAFATAVNHGLQSEAVDPLRLHKVITSVLLDLVVKSAVDDQLKKLKKTVVLHHPICSQ